MLPLENIIITCNKLSSVKPAAKKNRYMIYYLRNACNETLHSNYMKKLQYFYNVSCHKL